MISVIVCSRVEADFAVLERNVADTIGVPHEIIRIDNSSGALGICRAYNQGAESAANPLLCFVHEDVEFRAAGWGRRVQDAFATEPKLGVLGVGGSRVQSRFPSPWWVDETRIVQYHLQGAPADRAAPLEERFANIGPGERKEVAVLDGMLLVTPRSVWDEVRFDETRLPGFHAYDLDYTLAVRKAGRRALVDSGVLVAHYSLGSYNQAWLSASEALVRKWRRALPASVDPLTRQEEHRLYWKAVFDLMYRFRRMGLSKLRRYQVFARFFDWRYFDPRELREILTRLGRD